MLTLQVHYISYILIVIFCCKTIAISKQIENKTMNYWIRCFCILWKPAVSPPFPFLKDSITLPIKLVNLNRLKIISCNMLCLDYIGSTFITKNSVSLNDLLTEAILNVGWIMRGGDGTQRVVSSKGVCSHPQISVKLIAKYPIDVSVLNKQI